ncbi:DUF58 domain-containing protein [Ornithinimicrobium sp. Y1847]|uniref:DUF58 domain-containing protein n=1 Tax=Ornithinimicrobium sp. Y1847 TaxID=3405419 RepID=UPI003B679764
MAHGGRVLRHAPLSVGGDPRRIVWRASARRGDLLVRGAEHGITDTVCLLLDTAQSSYPLPHELSPVFEKAVAVAASVGTYHLGNGFSVLLEGGAGSLTGRLRGKEQRFELLDALAGVRRGKETLEDSVHRLLLQRASAGHHVVVTHDLSAPATAALRALVDQGRKCTLVLVVDGSTDVVVFQRAAVRQRRRTGRRPHPGGAAREPAYLRQFDGDGVPRLVAPRSAQGARRGQQRVSDLGGREPPPEAGPQQLPRDPAQHDADLHDREVELPGLRGLLLTRGGHPVPASAGAI